MSSSVYCLRGVSRCDFSLLQQLDCAVGKSDLVGLPIKVLNGAGNIE